MSPSPGALQQFAGILVMFAYESSRWTASLTGRFSMEVGRRPRRSGRVNSGTCWLTSAPVLYKRLRIKGLHSIPDAWTQDDRSRAAGQVAPVCWPDHGRDENFLATRREHGIEHIMNLRLEWLLSGPPWPVRLGLLGRRMPEPPRGPHTEGTEDDSLAQSPGDENWEPGLRPSAPRQGNTKWASTLPKARCGIPPLSH